MSLGEVTGRQSLGSERGIGAVRALIALLIVVTLAYGAFKLIPVRAAAFRFDDTVRELVVQAGVRRWPIADARLRDEIMARAEKLGLPVDRRNIVIRRGRDRMQIVVEYTVTVPFVFGYQFDWEFSADHDRPIF